MTDKTIDLDRHRGMAAQKATDRSPDVAPDLVVFIEHHFDGCDLLQSGVVHHGTGKASAVIGGRNSDLRRFL